MSFSKLLVGSYFKYCCLDSICCGSPYVWSRIATRIKGKRFGNRIRVLGLLTFGALFAIAILPLEIVEIIQIFMFAGIADYGNRYWIHILTAFVWIASLAYMIGICLVRSRYDERVRTIYQPYGGVQQQNRFIFIMWNRF